MDVKSDSTGNDLTTGTFKDMMHATKTLVDNLIVHSYGQELTMCTEYMQLEDDARIKLLKDFVIEQEIQTFFDVWLYGGSVPFRITTRTKVLHDAAYATDFDVDFGIYFQMMGSNQSFNEDVAGYYDLLNMETYPREMEDYVNTYIQVKDVMPLELHQFLKTKGFQDADWVTFNGQNVFFSFLFATKLHEDLVTFLMYLGKQAKIPETTLTEISLAEKHARVLDFIVIREQSMFGQREEWNWKFQSIEQEPLVIETYCKKKIRSIYFTSINQKFTNLVHQVDGDAEGDGIVSLVNQIKATSILFFQNRTAIDLSMYLFQNKSEFVLNISPKMAAFATKKMQHVAVFAMAKTPKQMRLDETENEMAFLTPFKQKSWLHLYHMGKKYRHSKTVLEDMTYLRSEDYLKQRTNTIFNLLYLWRTVKAETVNAWYNPTQNSITIPCGITRFPMFRNDVDYDIPFLGSVIGHEIGHATDSSGKNFDEVGNYLTQEEDVFTPTEQCLATDYGSMCGNDNYGVHTLGEDMADQFGLRMVLFLVHYELLYHINVIDYANNISATYKEQILDQYLSDARGELDLNRQTLLEDAYINFARVWCGRSTFTQECYNVETDVHALAKHRVIKTLRQFTSFKETFQCSKNDAMVSSNPCVIY